MRQYIPAHDEALLNSLGYQQELKREFSIFELFSVAFSIMSLIPSIASVLSDALPGGGIGSTWGWLVPSVLIFSVGISLGELGSAYPTSGGLYFWAFRFAPEVLKRPLSFLTAYANTLGLIAGMCSIDYGFANMLLSIPTVALDGDFVSTKFEAYGCLVGCVVVQGLINLLPSSKLAKIQAFSTTLNLVLVALICIALPIGASNKDFLNSGKFVFTDKTNLYTGWTYGGAFILSWMSCIWTIGAFDSVIHVSEEASNSTVAVPIGILLSIGLCGIFGFTVQAILVACTRDGNFQRIINSDSGQPLAQIIFDCLGKKWTIALMTLMAFASLLMGSSMLTAASRQSYATARDGVLPLSKFVRRINVKTAVPHWAIVFDCVVAIVIGLLVLIDSTAANALFSIYTSSNSLAWMIPILMRFLFPKSAPFSPGPFYLGKTLSFVNNGISIAYLTFVVFILSQLPQVKPVDKETMNYTCVINPAIWIGALAYYFISARHWFNGPVRTYIDPEYNFEKSDSKDDSSRDQDDDHKPAPTLTVQSSMIGLGV